MLLTRVSLAQGNGPAGHGGRAQALGNASATLAGEVWAVANNPAGLGTITQPTVGLYFENRYLLPSLNVAAVALALPLSVVEPAAAGQPARTSRGVLGLEAQRFGGVLYNETRVGAAYGYRLGVINIGGRLDALQVSFQDLGSRRVLAASLGGQAELLPRRLTLGVYLYNLTQAKLADYQDERVPTVLRVGLAYRPGQQVLLLVEAEKDVERAAGMKAGIEYRPTAAVAVRLGYASLSQQATGGVGLRAGDFQLDYAAGWHSALGLSQYFSLGWQWGKSEMKNLE
ncbi:hypothetical protein GKZ68_11890 [Hymenobacter sp. BRD128]|uniref:hypothetical protein n=1 Tax=Hymenobacter sp. BRD128 TaxID=2675878 RepID=UPI001567ACB0|nr:hypothetical protein [Hymenobacter sp. BRD128]QKG57257.1 hypothetical protein GKZ68_11890 [Hymenobacter sp. BRD128]